ncbi:MAG: Gfo/Idh/MocA family oxidoreductase [Kiritimatiellae bacterium]|jgi:myo-inositol 2-dehydrogenase/D-chiro-inositol 1-dehydrogenase|nr:Gfo/Idh/MocA family oxidoreductase [Kiritimatiellia bacterium]
MDNRRSFIKKSAVFSAMMAAAPTIVKAQGAAREFKVGLIGSGGRGTGAAKQMMEAAKNLGHTVKIIAIADFFEDKGKKAAKTLGCPENMVFVGPKAYHKVLSTDCDIVILAAPPAFRAQHLEASIKAGKHVFSEKPVAVDGPGVRQFIAAAAEAKAKKLAIVAGTQRRHQGVYLQKAKLLESGKIGKITGGAVYWNMSALWVRDRRPTDTNAGYLANNWVNWLESSGDHIVEQHVHQLDVVNWYMGCTPKSATGIGARHRRRSGNQYDCFSVDFDYGDGAHIHSMCRQISGCSNFVGERFRTPNCEFVGNAKSVKLLDGSKLDLVDCAHKGNPYVHEHEDLLKGILSGDVLNEGEQVAMSCATAIIGRISAYTGMTVRMSDLISNENSDVYKYACVPSAADFEKDGDVPLPAENVAPVPGKAKK